ncbi:hypothetical protein R1sor_005177 [Riccia sorocarpa]|uniref:AB hydrolase-1 domain-containing protein n=1 Tax=Riccia sorocarpa TaxID=122646 RepID=A0ABD3HN37_9MARC
MEATSIRRPLGLLTSGTSEASTTPQHSLGQGCTKLNDEVYEVYRPASGSFNLEVVFFHGFQRGDFGDAERRATGTWTTKDGTCWLKTWLVERFPQARILAVSYDSGTQVSESEARMDMYLICENLVQSLIDLAGVGQSCPMVLVGHCIGGLVLKALRHKYGWQTYSLFPANESRTSTLTHLMDEECNSSHNGAITPGFVSVVEEGSCRVDMDKFFTVLR